MTRGVMRFTPGWQLSLLAITLILTCIVLALWQWQRAQAKALWLEQFQQRIQQPPQPVSVVSEPWTPSKAQGYAQPHYLLYLDNRIAQGRVGYEVLLPLTQAQGTLWVNLGWLEDTSYRRHLPPLPEATLQAIDQLNQQQGLWQGLLRTPSDTWQLGQNESSRSDQWPKVVQRVDLQALQPYFDTPVLPWILELDAQHPASLTRLWTPVVMPPQRHLGYALQWLLMAFALLACYLYIGFSGRRR